MKVSTFTMTPTTLTSEGNNIKEVFLNAMLSEGHINTEQHELLNQYSVVICEKGFFGKFWDKLWNNPDDVKIIVVKVIENK